MSAAKAGSTTIAGPATTAPRKPREWVAGGSPGSRPFRGVSWRDGSHESALGSHGTADPDVGYTSIGFRVMRVIDPAHPAPLVASGG